MPKPTFTRTHEVDILPHCDFCVGRAIGVFNPQNDDQGKVRYDGPTRHGPWANMCQRHFESAGVGSLATKLVLKGDN